MKHLQLDDYQSKKILVTGASGFIGLHLVRALAGLNSAVTAGVRTIGDRPVVISDATSIVELQVTRSEQVESAIEKVKPDIIFHLAAAARDGAGMDEVETHNAVAMGGTINVASAALKHKVQMLIHLGSSEEYGDGRVPFVEEQAPRPVSPYSAAKVAATDYLLMESKEHALPVVIIRPTVIYGPGQNGNMFIPYVIDSYLANGEPPSLTDCEQCRDFLYVDDLIRALLEVGLRADLAGQIFNVGAGKSYRLKDVAQIISMLTGYKGDLGLGKQPCRTPNVLNHEASIKKAEQHLVWRPQIDLDEGLKRTIDSRRKSVVR